MARLKALPLPPEGTPFLLVLDEVNTLDLDFTDPDFAGPLIDLRDKSGARFVLVTTATLDVS